MHVVDRRYWVDVEWNRRPPIELKKCCVERRYSVHVHDFTICPPTFRGEGLGFLLYMGAFRQQRTGIYIFGCVSLSLPLGLPAVFSELDVFCEQDEHTCRNEGDGAGKEKSQPRAFRHRVHYLGTLAPCLLRSTG